jgi:hypothetical protein
MTKVSNVRFLMLHPALRRKETLAVVSCLIDGVEVRGIEVRHLLNNSVTLVWPSGAKAPSD